MSPSIQAFAVVCIAILLALAGIAAVVYPAKSRSRRDAIILTSELHTQSDLSHCLGVRILIALSSTVLILLASLITGSLAISAGSKAIDDTDATYTSGLDASFNAAKVNIALVNEWHMDKLCDAVTAKLAAYFTAPAMVLDQFNHFIGNFPREVRGDWLWINSTLRPQLNAYARAAFPLGISLVGIFEPNVQGDFTWDMRLSVGVDPKTQSRPPGQYRHIFTNEIWPDGWLPESWMSNGTCAMGDVGVAANGTFRWALIQKEAECASDEKHIDHYIGLPKVTSIEECAQRCFDEPDCSFFGVGVNYKEGACVWEKQISCKCPEGWEPDNYDSYELQTDPPRVAKAARMAWFGTSDAFGNIKERLCDEQVVTDAMVGAGTSIPLYDPAGEYATGRCSASFGLVEQGKIGGSDARSVEIAISRRVPELRVQWDQLERIDLRLGINLWSYWTVGERVLINGVQMDAEAMQAMLTSMNLPKGSRMYVVTDRIVDGLRVPSALAVSHGIAYQEVMILSEEFAAAAAASGFKLEPNSGKAPVPIEQVEDKIIRAHAVDVASHPGVYNYFRPEELYGWGCTVCDEGEDQFLVKVKTLADEYGLQLKVVLLIRNDVLMQQVDATMQLAKSDIAQSISVTEENREMDQARMIYVVGGCAFVLLMVSTCLAIAITEPLGVLREQMQAVAVMHLTAVDEQRPLSVLSEIRSMQRSFRTMVASLREYQQYLPHSILTYADSDDGDGPAEEKPAVSILVEHAPDASSQSPGGGRRSGARASATSSYKGGGPAAKKGRRVSAQSVHSTHSSSTYSSQSSGTGFSGGRKMAQKGSNPNLARMLRRKQVTLLCVNRVEFAECTRLVNPNLDAKVPGLLSDHLGMQLDFVKKHHGIADFFLGDRLWGSWNSARACPQHAAWAARCSVAALPANWQPDVRVPASMRRSRFCCAVVSGDGLCGSVGAPGMMRYSVLSPAALWVGVLERVARRWGLAAVVAAPAAQHAISAVVLRVVADVAFEKARRRQIRVFEGYRARDDTSLDDADEWTAYNVAWEYYSAGRYQDALRVLEEGQAASEAPTGAGAREEGVAQAYDTLHFRLRAAAGAGAAAPPREESVVSEVGITSAGSATAADPGEDAALAGLRRDAEARSRAAAAISARDQAAQSNAHQARMREKRQKLGARGGGLLGVLRQLGLEGWAAQLYSEGIMTVDDLQHIRTPSDLSDTLPLDVRTRLCGAGKGAQPRAVTVVLARTEVEDRSWGLVLTNDDNLLAQCAPGSIAASSRVACTCVGMKLTHVNGIAVNTPEQVAQLAQPPVDTLELNFVNFDSTGPSEDTPSADRKDESHESRDEGDLTTLLRDLEIQQYAAIISGEGIITLDDLKHVESADDMSDGIPCVVRVKLAEAAKGLRLNEVSPSVPQPAAQDAAVMRGRERAQDAKPPEQSAEPAERAAAEQPAKKQQQQQQQDELLDLTELMEQQAAPTSSQPVPSTGGTTAQAVAKAGKETPEDSEGQDAADWLQVLQRLRIEEYRGRLASEGISSMKDLQHIESADDLPEILPAHVRRKLAGTALLAVARPPQAMPADSSGSGSTADRHAAAQRPPQDPAGRAQGAGMPAVADGSLLEALRGMGLEQHYEALTSEGVLSVGDLQHIGSPDDLPDVIPLDARKRLAGHQPSVPPSSTEQAVLGERKQGDNEAAVADGSLLEALRGMGLEQHYEALTSKGVLTEGDLQHIGSPDDLPDVIPLDARKRLAGQSPVPPVRTEQAAQGEHEQGGMEAALRALGIEKYSAILEAEGITNASDLQFVDSVDDLPDTIPLDVREKLVAAGGQPDDDDAVF